MKNKKALSEIISYVMLITLTLVIAGGVYVWVKFYLPSTNPSQECPEEVSLVINNYYCTSDKIGLELKNNGNFNISGFIILVSDQTSSSPYLPLNAADNYDLRLGLNIQGTLYFAKQKRPGEKEWINFSRIPYSLTNLIAIKKIQIEPFLTNPENGKMLLCPKSIVNQNINSCD